ncbi:hypothetical protein [Streptomyces sp. NPDC054765]
MPRRSSVIAAEHGTTMDGLLEQPAFRELTEEEREQGTRDAARNSVWSTRLR